MDGNKRVAHAALETFLVLNGRELHADLEEAERTMLALAANLTFVAIDGATGITSCAGLHPGSVNTVARADRLLRS